MRKTITLILVVFQSGFALGSPLEGGARVSPASPPQADSSGDAASRSLFESLKGLVYQLKVASTAEAAKRSYGSAFVVDPSGVLATNYHVIRDTLHEENLKGFLVDPASPDPLETQLVAIDVIHDLALIQVKKQFPQAIQFRSTPLTNGEKTYSMGLPKDLVMSIIEGVYNGTKSRGIYDSMVLSSPLNEGMSGGPTVDHAGKLIGMNVAILRGANSLSFSIPSEHLARLLRERGEQSALIQARKWNEVIQRQLDQAQEKLSADLIAESGKALHLGDWAFKARPQNADCWQNEIKYENDKAKLAFSSCALPFDAQVTDMMASANYAVRVMLLQSDPKGTRIPYRKRNELLPFLEIDRWKRATWSKDYFGRKCHQMTVVNRNQLPILVGYCIVSYRNFKDLYNLFLEGITIGADTDETVSVQAWLYGFNRKNIGRITQALLNGVERK